MYPPYKISFPDSATISSMPKQTTAITGFITENETEITLLISEKNKFILISMSILFALYS